MVLDYWLSKMVNTRRGKYQTRSTPVGFEDVSTKTNMHGVRMRGINSKLPHLDVPTVYRLKEVRYHLPILLRSLLHDDLVNSNAFEHVGHQKSNLSDMDSDERDDVPLVHILKRGVFSKKSQPDVSIPDPSAATHSLGVSSVSLHSTSSSSQDDILASNVPQHSSGNVSQGPNFR